MKKINIIIKPFMIDLNLTMTELLTYAIIYNFSKREQDCCFSQDDFGRQIGKTRTVVGKAIKNLINKKLIIKQGTGRDENYVSVERANNTQGVDSSVVEKLLPKILIDCKPGLSEREYEIIAKEYNQSHFARDIFRTLSQIEKFKKQIINGNYKTYTKKNQNPFVIQNSYERKDMTAQEINAIFEALTYDDL